MRVYAIRCANQSFLKCTVQLAKLRKLLRRFMTIDV